MTKAEYAVLKARTPAPVTEGWKDGALTVWVPGTPKHFKGKGDRYTVARHTKDWRARTVTAIYRVRFRSVDGADAGFPSSPERPKRITFTVFCRNAFDSDENLRLVCSPLKDALIDMRLIQDDRDSAGHTFIYLQVPSRVKGAALGIAVRVELAP